MEERKRIFLKDGHVDVPADWIPIEVEKNENSTQIHVIEMRNGDFPHFFYTDNSKEVTDEIEQSVLKKIKEKFPWFQTDVLDKQVEAIWENGKFTNVAEWDAAPTIGIFTVFYEDVPNVVHPYGVKICRDK